MIYWEVAVKAPLNQLLTYQTEDDSLKPGDSVIVPLGKRQCAGIIIRPGNQDTKFTIKDILNKNKDRPSIDEKNLKWGLWLSQYYVHPPGPVFESFFPPLKKKGRGSQKSIDGLELINKVDLILNPEQEAVRNTISEITGYGSHLIYGVTGSGKTEVYLKLIEEKIAEGKQCVFLVPEISLTPQLIQRFVSRLGPIVSVFHSQLTAREKTEQWWQVFSGEKQVMLGARSALFCPMKNLGLIVIDEEHEANFKQDEKLKYHARDAAVMKAHLFDCPVLLGSATPCLESWQNVKEKKYHLHEIKNRHGGSNMPELSVVDMEKERRSSNKELPFWLSNELFEKLNTNYAEKKQAALFLNRRGIAPVVQCTACGFSYACPNCDISLALHGDTYLVCHYCNFSQSLDTHCPECKEAEPRPTGFGTELIQRDLEKLFPRANIIRLDRDEISKREELEEVIEQIESGAVDFIVGTQMISKGLDFENLNLVGVVMADIAINIPDFRASEKAFQIITQVAGRAGRRKDQGKVVIQTYRPNHLSISSAAKQDFTGFAKKELEQRKELFYPPFTNLGLIRLQGIHKTKVLQASEHLRQWVDTFVEKNLMQIQVLGPAPSALARVRNKYRFQLLIKSSDRKSLNKLAWKVMALGQTSFPGVRVMVDIDPQNLM